MATDPKEPQSEVTRGAARGDNPDTWAEVPRMLRESEFLLPPPWQDIFGPLRRGLVDDMVAGGFRTHITPLNLAIDNLSTLPEDRGEHSLSAQTGIGATVKWKGELGLNPVVASGELWVGRVLMKRLLNAVNTRFPTAPAWSAALTEREAQVARSAAEGASNAEIGERLGITERTVKAHLTAIFDKLQVGDRVQLALKVHGLR